MARDSLLGEVIHAVESVSAHVYACGRPTPCESVPLPNGSTLHLKREDLSPIHAYKWRGAVARMATLKADGVARVVAASAGNHAQGVAHAAARLGMRADVFMPRDAAGVKRRAVKRFGGRDVTIRLVTGTFDDAARAARDHARVTGAAPVHPFDDLHVIAGQGTIAREIADSGTRPDRVFVPIGGGGLAAGVGAVLASLEPALSVVGVEAAGQDSMRRALEAGRPVTMETVDGYCDGTAVGRVGDLTYRVCAETLDDVVVVTNDDVDAATAWAWEIRRLLPEPSGALAIAAALAAVESGNATEPLAIVSGANADLGALTRVAAHAAR